MYDHINDDVTLGIGNWENNGNFYLVILLLSDVTYLISLSFKQLEEAERKRIEDLKEKERQKVTKELELWKKQQKDAEKQKSVQKEGELYQVEQLKEKKKEKINKNRIPNEGTSKTRLKPTKGCIIEVYFIILQSVGISLFLDVSNSSFIFVSTITN